MKTTISMLILLAVAACGGSPTPASDTVATSGTESASSGSSSPSGQIVAMDSGTPVPEAKAPVAANDAAPEAAPVFPDAGNDALVVMEASPPTGDAAPETGAEASPPPPAVIACNGASMGFAVSLTYDGQSATVTSCSAVGSTLCQGYQGVNSGSCQCTGTGDTFCVTTPNTDHMPCNQGIFTVSYDPMTTQVTAVHGGEVVKFLCKSSDN